MPAGSGLKQRPGGFFRLKKDKPTVQVPSTEASGLNNQYSSEIVEASPGPTPRAEGRDAKSQRDQQPSRSLFGLPAAQYRPAESRTPGNKRMPSAKAAQPPALVVPKKGGGNNTPGPRTPVNSRPSTAQSMSMPAGLAVVQQQSMELIDGLLGPGSTHKFQLHPAKPQKGVADLLEPKAVAKILDTPHWLSELGVPEGPQQLIKGALREVQWLRRVVEIAHNEVATAREQAVAWGQHSPGALKGLENQPLSEVLDVLYKEHDANTRDNMELKTLLEQERKAIADRSMDDQQGSAALAEARLRELEEARRVLAEERSKAQEGEGVRAEVAQLVGRLLKDRRLHGAITPSDGKVLRRYLPPSLDMYIEAALIAQPVTPSSIAPSDIPVEPMLSPFSGMQSAGARRASPGDGGPARIVTAPSVNAMAPSPPPISPRKDERRTWALVMRRLKKSRYRARVSGGVGGLADTTAGLAFAKRRRVRGNVSPRHQTRQKRGRRLDSRVELGLLAHMFTDSKVANVWDDGEGEDEEFYTPKGSFAASKAAFRSNSAPPPALPAPEVEPFIPDVEPRFTMGAKSPSGRYHRASPVPSHHSAPSPAHSQDPAEITPFASPQYQGQLPSPSSINLVDISHPLKDGLRKPGASSPLDAIHSVTGAEQYEEQHQGILGRIMRRAKTTDADTASQSAPPFFGPLDPAKPRLKMYRNPADAAAAAAQTASGAPAAAPGRGRSLLQSLGLLGKKSSPPPPLDIPDTLAPASPIATSATSSLPASATFRPPERRTGIDGGAAPAGRRDNRSPDPRRGRRRSPERIPSRRSAASLSPGGAAAGLDSPDGRTRSADRARPPSSSAGSGRQADQKRRRDPEVSRVKFADDTEDAAAGPLFKERAGADKRPAGSPTAAAVVIPAAEASQAAPDAVGTGASALSDPKDSAGYSPKDAGAAAAGPSEIDNPLYSSIDSFKSAMDELRRSTDSGVVPLEPTPEEPSPSPASTGATMSGAGGPPVELGPMLQAIEDARQQHGNNSAEATAAMTVLADQLREDGMLPDAEHFYRMALGGVRQRVGLEKAEAADALGNLTKVMEADGRLMDSETMLRQAVWIMEQDVGSSDPRTAALRMRLADVLRRMNRMAEAQGILAQAITSDTLTDASEPQPDSDDRSPTAIATMPTPFGPRDMEFQLEPLPREDPLPAAAAALEPVAAAAPPAAAAPAPAPASPAAAAAVTHSALSSADGVAAVEAVDTSSTQAVDEVPAAPHPVTLPAAVALPRRAAAGGPSGAAAAAAAIAARRQMLRAQPFGSPLITPTSTSTTESSGTSTGARAPLDVDTPPQHTEAQLTVAVSSGAPVDSAATDSPHLPPFPHSPPAPPSPTSPTDPPRDFSPGSLPAIPDQAALAAAFGGLEFPGREEWYPPSLTESRTSGFTADSSPKQLPMSPTDDPLHPRNHPAPDSPPSLPPYPTAAAPHPHDDRHPTEEDPSSEPQLNESASDAPADSLVPPAVGSSGSTEVSPDAPPGEKHAPNNSWKPAVAFHPLFPGQMHEDGESSDPSSTSGRPDRAPAPPSPLNAVPISGAFDPTSSDDQISPKTPRAAAAAAASAAAAAEPPTAASPTPVTTSPRPAAPSADEHDDDGNDADDDEPTRPVLGPRSPTTLPGPSPDDHPLPILNHPIITSRNGTTNISSSPSSSAQMDSDTLHLSDSPMSPPTDPHPAVTPFGSPFPSTGPSALTLRAPQPPNNPFGSPISSPVPDSSPTTTASSTAAAPFGSPFPLSAPTPAGPAAATAPRSDSPPPDSPPPQYITNPSSKSSSPGIHLPLPPEDDPPSEGSFSMAPPVIPIQDPIADTPFTPLRIPPAPDAAESPQVRLLSPVEAMDDIHVDTTAPRTASAASLTMPAPSGPSGPPAPVRILTPVTSSDDVQIEFHPPSPPAPPALPSSPTAATIPASPSSIPSPPSSSDPSESPVPLVFPTIALTPTQIPPAPAAAAPLAPSSRTSSASSSRLQATPGAMSTSTSMDINIAPAAPTRPRSTRSSRSAASSSRSMEGKSPRGKSRLGPTPEVPPPASPKSGTPRNRPLQAAAGPPAQPAAAPAAVASGSRITLADAPTAVVAADIPEPPRSAAAQAPTPPAAAAPATAAPAPPSPVPAAAEPYSPTLRISSLQQAPTLADNPSSGSSTPVHPSPRNPPAPSPTSPTSPTSPASPDAPEVVSPRSGALYRAASAGRALLPKAGSGKKLLDRLKSSRK